jgi:hypothetical protein
MDVGNAAEAHEKSSLRNLKSLHVQLRKLDRRDRNFQHMPVPEVHLLKVPREARIVVTMSATLVRTKARRGRRRADTSLGDEQPRVKLPKLRCYSLEIGRLFLLGCPGA